LLQEGQPEDAQNHHHLCVQVVELMVYAQILQIKHKKRFLSYNNIEAFFRSKLG
jgi:hypothetical protein